MLLLLRAQPLVAPTVHRPAPTTHRPAPTIHPPPPLAQAIKEGANRLRRKKDLEVGARELEAAIEAAGSAWVEIDLIKEARAMVTDIRAVANFSNLGGAKKR